jgi:hypothetical protein
MSRSLYFYNVFITYNEQKTDIKLSNLLDDIIVLPSEQILKGTRYGEIAMNHMLMPIDDPRNERSDDRIVAFSKYRDRKPFLGTKGTIRADEIADDVLEINTAMFLSRYHMAIIEYNHHGCRVKAIEAYLKSFLPNGDENNRWGIEFINIEPALGIRDIRMSRDIRQIQFKLDLTTHQRNQINRRNQDNNESLLGSLFQKAVQMHTEFGANSASLIFGNGRKRNDVIEAESLIQLIDALDTESDLFEGILVRYKSPSTNEIENVDIKSAGVLKQIIMHNDNGNNWEYIGRQIIETFYNQRQGHNYYQRYFAEIIPFRYAGINVDPIII